MRRKLIAAIGVAAVLTGVAACGGSSDKSDSGKGSSAGPADFKGKTLNVWLMSGSNPPGWTKDITAAFEKQYPGAKLKITVQQWDGIQQKLTTALSESTPPDVIEVGNTQTPYYAATGGLKDLSSVKSDIGGDDWVPALNGSAVYDGKQFAAPWYFASRVVVYNKKIWTAAGITTTPKTQDELFSDLDKIKAKGTKDAFYLPGQDWYGFDGFLLDAGADLVKKDGDKYTGNLDTPQAASAINLYKKLNSYGTAPKDKDEATPQQSDVFAKGDVGAFLGLGWEAAGAISKNAALKDQVGYFAFPGKTAAKTASVFVGGSNLAISQGSKNPELAQDFLKLAMSDQFEGELAKEGGVVPNKSSLDSNLTGNAFGSVSAAAAANGGTTPLIPAWGNVENAPNPITTLFMTGVLQGQSPSAAAKKADTEIDKRLSQQ
ncbi:putative sugar transporter sugar binding protein [Actinacidiphila reveromycinica]|uniref:Putative sugar transporter sugar binding protein n=1 Tax=Actinacidiphila reveromycinica TaxID=659352 RepID=A0A7U3UWN4_9ACTN|nr:extracellular solute-binding protein [Streptomyces sp. SN-593]BBA99991.1 putative sugar transporter sugar binding protein [Streptomyces sp. SN-593]